MRGDVVKATELMEKAGYPNGYDGHILLVGAAGWPQNQLAESVRVTLEKLGFTNIEVRLPPFSNYYTKYCALPDSNVAVGTATEWCKDYNDAVTFFHRCWSRRSLR
jgi:ABC-type transport system substrate-binding protein